MLTLLSLIITVLRPETTTTPTTPGPMHVASDNEGHEPEDGV